MALHFSGEVPEDQFYTDFGNLNKFQDEVRINKFENNSLSHTLSGLSATDDSCIRVFSLTSDS